MSSNEIASPVPVSEQGPLAKTLLTCAQQKAKNLEYDEKGQTPTKQVSMRVQQGLWELFQERANEHNMTASAFFQATMELYLLAPSPVLNEVTEYTENRYNLGALSRRPRRPRRRNRDGK